MTASISDWLKELDFGQYAALFVDNEVDLQTLKILGDGDLKELGLPFGPRKRLLAALRQGQPAETVKRAAAPGGERRQLTVLFCHLVGFTELTLGVDPQLLETIIREYEDACATCIGRYDGFIYRLLGDGILAFFGFPLAHEGEAARAIRAALEIVETISRLEVPEVGRLKVRIGIATGIVGGRRQAQRRGRNHEPRGPAPGRRRAGRHRGERARPPARRRRVRLRESGQLDLKASPRRRGPTACWASARRSAASTPPCARRCRPSLAGARDGAPCSTAAVGPRPWRRPGRAAVGRARLRQEPHRQRPSRGLEAQARARCAFNARPSTSAAPSIRSAPISSGRLTSTATICRTPGWTSSKPVCPSARPAARRCAAGRRHAVAAP